MKIKIYNSLLIFILTTNIYSQFPVTQTINYNTPGSAKVSPGTYIKDINGDFESFTGTWIWNQNDQQIIIVIKKINQFYNLKKYYYKDFLVADYIYTTNNGATTIVNSSVSLQNSENVGAYAMVSALPEPSLNVIEFSFKDVGIDKHMFSYPSATFTKLNNGLNQMSFVLKNPEGLQGYLNGQPPPNFNFSLPSNIVLTKQ